ncbi:MAG: flagellar protein [Calditrichaeota bacterium]|nr:flagellar protein [Calditrichota bacterium]
MKVGELQLNQSLKPIQPQKVNQGGSSSAKKAKSVAFGSLLQKSLNETGELRFSAHALKRMENRSLSLSEIDLQRLQQGVQQLKAKGAQNSVILMDDRAFVVSVRNRTVVTAIDQAQSNERIFTNIDSLAIV